tara:strand:- start:352 stop:537 length:186 start_codon:yes stop_codon:yes gene_type:complete
MNNFEYQLAMLIFLIDQSANDLDTLLKLLELDQKANSHQVEVNHKIRTQLLQLKSKINENK